MVFSLRITSKKLIFKESDCLLAPGW